MDGRERLRAYLEQRRELGESEFVLDSMSIDEALKAIDKLRVPTTARPAQSSQPLRPPQSARQAELPARPVTPPVAAPAPRVAPPPAETRQQPPAARARVADRVPEVREDSPRATGDRNRSAAEDEAMKTERQGIVVGNANGTLFEQNPFHSVGSTAALAKLIEDCTRCPLYETARNAVPGSGDPTAELMCVGEAPGANEDETGQPFVGQAGGLLTKILAAIDLTRDQVFITNVLKHRPPGNRNPAPNEVEACSPYLVRQIQMIKPKVILALGTFAAQTLLDTKTPIGKLRGAVHRYYGIPLIVTYHPAALLRNPAWKRPTWEDVKLARHVLDSSKS
jgi:uracil-DNA glycosylase family 4